MKDILKAPKLTNEELCESIQKGNKEAEAILYEKNKGFIIMKARKFENMLNNKLDLEDLVQEGSLGLLEAARRFDFSKKNKFITYANYYVENAIRNVIHNYGTSIRVPSNKLEEISHNNVHELEDNEDLIDIRKNIIGIDSIDRIYHDSEQSVLDKLSGDLGSLEDIVNRKDLSEKLYDMVNSLPKLQRDVITSKYGLDGYKEKKIADIAREKNISRDRVVYAERKALETLNDLASKKGLRDYID